MAKDTLDKVKSTAGVISSFVSKAVDAFLGNMLDTVRDEAHQLIEHVEERVAAMQRRLIIGLYVLGFISIGLFFLLVSVVFFFIENLQVSKAATFMILGLVLLVLGAGTAILISTVSKNY